MFGATIAPAPARRRGPDGRPGAHRGVAARAGDATPRGYQDPADGMRAATSTIMASTGTKTGFALAWIIGIPLPILLVIYLISRC
ncbi:MAG TPA: hypothetical protein VHW23_29060 [Kofleriaceae bacterium]|nr:hypothetical protein [Kofleriaceae bacterium]